MKKLFRYAIFSIAAYLVLLILNYFYIAIVNDYSLRAPEMNQVDDSVYLISYADAKAYYIQNQNAMAATAMNKGIDVIINYRKKHIPNDYIQKHPHFKVKHGAGLWLWKPYLIYQTLKDIPEGAYLIFMDSAFVIKKSFTPLLKSMKQDMLFVYDVCNNPKNQIIRKLTKGNVLRRLSCDEKCQRAPEIAAGAMIIRNTPISRKLIKTWLEYCEDIKILDPSITENIPHHPDYLWSLPEQSVLSILVHKNQQICDVRSPEIFTKEYALWAHRKSAQSSPHKIYYSIYGAFYVPWRKSPKALISISIMNFPLIVYVRKKLYDFFDA